MNRISSLGVLVGGYILLAISVALLYEWPFVLLSIVVCMSLFYLRLSQTKRASSTYILGFSLGPLGESVCVYLGAWSYAHTPLIPIWLPPAWGLISVLFDGINNELVKWRLYREET